MNSKLRWVCARLINKIEYTSVFFIKTEILCERLSNIVIKALAYKIVISLRILSKVTRDKSLIGAVK